MGNIARARIANRAGAALFLRIHADGSTDPSARGTHTLYPALRRGWTDDVYAESKRAARVVQARASRALGFPDRGLQERSDFTGFNWADVPVILVEMGFMTNPTEDRLLATAAYQRRAALGLCRGTLRYLGPRRRVRLTEDVYARASSRTASAARARGRATDALEVGAGERRSCPCARRRWPSVPVEKADLAERVAARGSVSPRSFTTSAVPLPRGTASP